VDIRPLNRTKLNHENGLDAQRLLPWNELNAPFEGSWCVIRPGTASTAHSHTEHEIFIALSGWAVLDSEGSRARFSAGDIVRFEPGTEHRVINESDTDFEMYSVWWDTDIAANFLRRNESEG
jgi:mannose-6-phosphate isomerase-like protein (cupin superfamily)